MTSALLAVAAAAAMTTAAAAPRSDAGTVFDGYAAFYDTLPDRLFNRDDAVALTPVGGDPDHPRAHWEGTVPGVRGEHKVDLRETTPVVDGRSLSLRPEAMFPGATSMPLGARATLYVNDRALCFEGQPAAGSGTADRYVQVTLVLDPFSPKARRYELPRLFASCLGVTQADGRPVGFLEATLRQPEGAGEPRGVDFTAWTIAAGAFRRGTTAVRTDFVEPGNVFRFKLAATPAS